MMYNLYEAKFEQVNFLKKKLLSLSGEKENKLRLLEEEISSEFLKKQKGRIGIKSLGNEIRYNKSIKKILREENSDYVLLKMTENKRSFLTVFLNSLLDHPLKKIYFLIFSRDFGEKSMLVDKTFADIKDIKAQLNTVLKSFKLINSKRQIFFIEITAMTNYYFETIEKKYSKIHKL